MNNAGKFTSAAGIDGGKCSNCYACITACHINVALGFIERITDKVNKLNDEVGLQATAANDFTAIIEKMINALKSTSDRLLALQELIAVCSRMR